VMVDSHNNSEALRHKMALMLEYPCSVLFGLSPSLQLWTSFYHHRFKPAGELPDNAHVLTLKVRNRDQSPPQVVLRLQHLLEAGEHPVFSRNVSVDASDLFRFGFIRNFTEKTLSLALDKNKLHRQQWNIRSSSVTASPPSVALDNPRNLDPQNPLVTLSPAQIRTFTLQLDRSKLPEKASPLGFYS